MSSLLTSPNAAPPKGGSQSLPSEAAPARASARMDYIDILRGLACLWVVVFHSYMHVPRPYAQSRLAGDVLHYLTFAGWMGVSLFLVLSGFCLYYPLVRKAEVSSVRVDLKTFARRRATRILPPYYAAIAVACSFIAVNAARHHMPLAAALPSASDLVKHIFMVHNFWADDMYNINAALWSLALESQLYVVFPLLVLCAARFRLRSIVGISLVLALAAQLATARYYAIHPPAGTPERVMFDSILGRGFEFVMGMAAAALTARPAPRWERWLPATLAVSLAAVAWFATRYSQDYPLQNQFQGLLFASLIVVLRRVPSARFDTPLAKLLTWIGTFSYSIYLIHIDVINKLVLLLNRPTHAGPKLLIVFGVVAASVGCGYVFHLCFERPFMVRRKNETFREIAQDAVYSPAP